MKRGFTLVELLAVIVVLAVLATIAVPIVGTVIEAGRKSAIENSVTFYVKEVESKFSEWTIEGMPDELIYEVVEDDCIEIEVWNLDKVLKLEGERPTNGVVKIDNNYSNSNSFFGYVVSATLKYENGYTVMYTYHTEDGYTDDRVEIEITKE